MPDEQQIICNQLSALCELRGFPGLTWQAGDAMGEYLCNTSGATSHRLAQTLITLADMYGICHRPIHTITSPNTGVHLYYPKTEKLKRTIEAEFRVTGIKGLLDELTQGSDIEWEFSEEHLRPQGTAPRDGDTLQLAQKAAMVESNSILSKQLRDIAGRRGNTDLARSEIHDVLAEARAPTGEKFLCRLAVNALQAAGLDAMIYFERIHLRYDRAKGPHSEYVGHFTVLVQSLPQVLMKKATSKERPETVEAATRIINVKMEEAQRMVATDQDLPQPSTFLDQIIEDQPRYRPDQERGL